MIEILTALGALWSLRGPYLCEYCGAGVEQREPLHNLIPGWSECRQCGHLMPDTQRLREHRSKCIPAPGIDPRTGLREVNGSNELEKSVEDYLVSRVEALGGLCVKLVLLGLRGWPDRVVILRGRTFFVELKRAHKGSKLSPQQEYWERRLNGAGVVLHVPRTCEDIDTLIEYMLQVTE